MTIRNRYWIGRVMLAAAAGVTGMLMTIPVWAGEARYENPVLSDTKGGAAKNKFSKDTAQLVLVSKITDVPNGAKLKAAWIAEKTKVAPPNYRIDSYELTKGPLINTVTFTMSRPTKGWPVGDYRVDLFINDKAAGLVRFSVAD